MIRATVLLPELLVGVTAMAAAAAPLLRPRLARGLGAGVLLGLAAALILELTLGAGVGTLYHGGFRQDRFALFAKIAILVTTLLWTALHDGEGERSGLLAPALLACLGAMVTASAGTLAVLWGGVELASLAAVAAAAQRSRIQALRLLLLSSALGGALAVGLAMIYATTGVGALSDLHRTAAVEVLSLSLGISVLVAVGSLAARAVSIPHQVGGVAAGAALIAALRLLGALAPAGQAWGAGLAALAGLTLVIAALLALAAPGPRSLGGALALGQIGWIGAGLGTHFAAGLAAAMLGLGALLLAIGALPVALGAAASADLPGLRARALPRVVAGSVALLSLAGMPPLAGSLADFAIAAALVRSGLAWVLAPALFFSVVALYAVVRLVRAALIAPVPDEPRAQSRRGAAPAPTALARGALWAAAALPLLFFLLANPISSLAEQGAAAIAR